MPRAAKEIVDIRSLARSHTTTAIKVLAGIMSEPEAAPAARVTAACQLLDRGWGKPAQMVTGADGGDIKVIIRQIIDSGDKEEPLLIETQRRN